MDINGNRAKWVYLCYMFDDSKPNWPSILRQSNVSSFKVVISNLHKSFGWFFGEWLSVYSDWLPADPPALGPRVMGLSWECWLVDRYHDSIERGFTSSCSIWVSDGIVPDLRRRTLDHTVSYLRTQTRGKESAFWDNWSKGRHLLPLQGWTSGEEVRSLLDVRF